MNITRMPVDNAEYMQILRYEPGQFYRVHHDQQTAHWTPQGVRVYTFFVYLSEVEEGGGTKFNDLGLEVTPKPPVPWGLPHDSLTTPWRRLDILGDAQAWPRRAMAECHRSRPAHRRE